MVDLRAAMIRFCVLASAGVTASLGLWCLAPSATETATANGDTRTLHLYHTHTGETIDATFRVDGHYDPTVLAQLNHFLRDWRNNDEHQMDPRLFDAVWEAYRSAGAGDRVQIYSAYRSPQTNAMLRRRSRAVAEHSQHMLGKAMDTTMPGFPMQRVREAGMKLQHGGVGWYPSANFVHLDVGGVRSWPRMSYDQLAQIFPDGKTVHISSDGRTLPGYDQARIEIAERGGTEIPPAQESSGFFAWLFGGGSGNSAGREDEEERRAPVAVASVAQPTRPVAQPVEQVATQQAPALAYAANAPAEPPSPQIETPARSSRQQVASLEAPDPAAASASDASVTVMPLPPRRPVDLADETAEIPLPPARPESLDRLHTASIRYSDAQGVPVRADAIGGMITASPSGVPAIRRSSLPALITRGPGRRPPDRALLPNRMLAFASAEAIPEFRAVPLPVSRPADLAKPMALRSARRRPPVAASPLQAANVGGKTAVVTSGGPRLTGLRRAAKLMGDRAAL